MSQQGYNFDDIVPWSDQLTDYDRNHSALYIRLLDAESDGASLEEIAAVIFGLAPQTDPDRARRIVTAHLKRAHWIVNGAYRALLQR